MAVQTPPPVKPRTLGLAVASLILGILGVTCFSILAGIPALILGIVALNKISRSGGALGGKGMAVAGVCTGGFSILVIPILAGMLLPALAQAREKARSINCMANAKQIMLGIMMYAGDNAEKLPESLDQLEPYVGGKESMQKLLTCPTSGAYPCFELLEGGKASSGFAQMSETVVLREIASPHIRKRVVGYADGHVEMTAGE